MHDQPPPSDQSPDEPIPIVEPDNPVLFHNQHHPCRKCGVALPEATSGHCPACGATQARMCTGCGYDLAGLSRDGNCPECGTPVAKSYAPDLLENRSAEYLTLLRTGFGLVVFGIIAQIALSLLFLVGGVALVVASGGTGGIPFSPKGLEFVLEVVGFGFSVVVLLGWWRISTPDPARVGTELDVGPRRVIRVAVMLQASAQLAGLVPSAVILADPTLALGLQWTADVISGVAGIAWIVQFFAAMLYLQWLAQRVPDVKLQTDARRFMWLGPLLYIVGAACLGIGPLVALVLYLVMLFRLRGHLTAILIRLGRL